MNNKDTVIPQNILIENRKRLKVTGVKDIDGFTESKVVVETVLGELAIKGSDLHVITLQADSGELLVTGEISSLCYTGFNANAGLFRRIFR